MNMTMYWISVFNSSPVHERRNVVLCCEHLYLWTISVLYLITTWFLDAGTWRKAWRIVFFFSSWSPGGLTCVHKTIISQVVCGLNDMRQTALFTVCCEDEGDFFNTVAHVLLSWGVHSHDLHISQISVTYGYWLHLYRFCPLVLYWSTVSKCDASQSKDPCCRNATVIPFSWLV